MQFQQLSDIEEMNEETLSYRFPLLSRLMQGVGSSPLASSAALSAPLVAPGSRLSFIKRSTSNVSESSEVVYPESPHDLPLYDPLTPAEDSATPLLHIESPSSAPSNEISSTLLDTIQAFQDGETTT